MGVDCDTTFPPGTRVSEIITVMGIAAGLPFTKEPLLSLETI